MSLWELTGWPYRQACETGVSRDSVCPKGEAWELTLATFGDAPRFPCLLVPDVLFGHALAPETPVSHAPSGRSIENVIWIVARFNYTQMPT
jgi:hypothetical protein